MRTSWDDRKLFLHLEDSSSLCIFTGVLAVGKPRAPRPLIWGKSIKFVHPVEGFVYLEVKIICGCVCDGKCPCLPSALKGDASFSTLGGGPLGPVVVSFLRAAPICGSCSTCGLCIFSVGNADHTLSLATAHWPPASRTHLGTSGSSWGRMGSYVISRLLVSAFALGNTMTVLGINKILALGKLLTLSASQPPPL